MEPTLRETPKRQLCQMRAFFKTESGTYRYFHNKGYRYRYKEENCASSVCNFEMLMPVQDSKHSWKGIFYVFL